MIMFPIICPNCQNELASQNAGLRALCEIYIRARAGGKITPRSIVHLPTFIEDELWTLRPEEVGADLIGKILLLGVRGTFLTLFGLQIRWGAEKLEISDARIVP